MMDWFSFFIGAASALVAVGGAIVAYAIKVNRGDPPYEPRIKDSEVM